MRRLVLAVSGSVVALVALVAVAGSPAAPEGMAQVPATVCTRSTCVPYGGTQTTATPDGTRPPTFTATPIGTGTTVRPTNTAVATVGTVCNRSGTCVPNGGQ